MKRESCNYCGYYSAYYKQWSDSYGRLNHGYCSKHEKEQTQFESCGCFKSDDEREERRSERRMKSLERALASIIDIALILNEKEKEK